MNYRHAFHAGNFADVMKHVLLLRILEHLREKPAPFRVVDTHAGLGRYNLSAEEAERTQEWRHGVGRMAAPFAPDVETLLAPYRVVLAETQARYGEAVYPGSPAIIRERLRRDDRAVFTELHPEDYAVLRERFNTVSTTKVLQLDGWLALGSLIPPRERRGLVLIDPPYEVPGELSRAAQRLNEAVSKWPTGIFALWHPIKDPAAVDRFVAALAADLRREAIRLELTVDRPGQNRLVGSGLVVINPPWRLQEEAAILLPALAERLGGELGGWRCEGLAPAEAPVRRAPPGRRLSR